MFHLQNCHWLAQLNGLTHLLYLKIEPWDERAKVIFIYKIKPQTGLLTLCVSSGAAFIQLLQTKTSVNEKFTFIPSMTSERLCRFFSFITVTCYPPPPSPCSRGWGWCLDDAPVKDRHSWSSVLPGAVYSAVHQCRLQYGSSSRLCDDMDVRMRKQTKCFSLLCSELLVSSSSLCIQQPKNIFF